MHVVSLDINQLQSDYDVLSSKKDSLERDYASTQTKLQKELENSFAGLKGEVHQLQIAKDQLQMEKDKQEIINLRQEVARLRSIGTANKARTRKPPVRESNKRRSRMKERENWILVSRWDPPRLRI